MYGESSRHSSPRCFQDALSYLVSLLLSFFISVKTTFSGPAHPEQNHEYVLVYPYLPNKSIESSYTFDFGLDLYPGAPNVKEHPCEIHEASGDSSVIVPNPISPISPSRYKPLQLPPILHDFPVKYTSTSPSSTENLKT